MASHFTRVENCHLAMRHRQLLAHASRRINPEAERLIFDVPETYKEIVGRSDEALWQQAVNEETTLRTILVLDIQQHKLRHKNRLSARRFRFGAGGVHEAASRLRPKGWNRMPPQTLHLWPETVRMCLER